MTKDVQTKFATIDQTVMQLHAALQEYIEAAYHISDPQMVKERADTSPRARRDPPAPVPRKHSDDMCQAPKYSDIQALIRLSHPYLLRFLNRTGQNQFSTTLHIFIRRRPSREYSSITRA